MTRYPCCPDAVAFVRGGSENPRLSGQVRFYQERDSVLVEAEISGLPKNNEAGFFALHIHEGDSCSGEDFAETGGHYNPEETSHPKHAGDLPPLLMTCDGSAYHAVRTDRVRVVDILGKTVVIHSDPDDFHSQPSGKAGTKIACGVIRKKRDFSN